MAAEGVANSFIRTDATLDTTGLFPALGDVPAITWGTGFVEGTATGLIRTDATLQYPPALGVTASPITGLLTLTDDGTEGALLTASNTYAVNGLALKAPNATNTLRVGKYGNLALAGTALSDTALLNFTKSYDESAATPNSINATMTNTNVGTASGAIIGIVANIIASMTTAGASSTNPALGTNIIVTGGAIGNNNFRGSIIVHRAASIAQSQTAGTATVPLMVNFQSGSTATGAFNVTRSAVTDAANFYARSGVLSFSGTLTNLYGLLVDPLTIGTNRYGVNVAAITGGTVATGIEIATHSGGTTRRGLRSGNTNESTTGDWLCSAAARGLLNKDTQGTPEYWRTYIDSTGTKDMTMTVDSTGFASFTRAASATGDVLLKVIDTGTTAPTT